MTTLMAFSGPVAVQDVVSSLASERSTFHTFEMRSRRLLYDLNSGTLLELNPAAFMLLRGIEHGIPPDLIDQHLRDELPSEEARQNLFSEILKLRQAGLFELEPLESKEERDRVVDSYLEHHPNKMMLLIHTSCNLKCHYCYEVQSQFHQTGGAMPFPIAQKAVDDLIEKSGNRKNLEITFFGGEPLLNFRGMKRVVKYTREAAAQVGKSIYFQMTTNGVLLSDEVIDYVIAEGIGVMVSFDGTAEQNDIHRINHAGEGVGTQVLTNLKKLIARQKAAGQRLAKVRATMTRENRDSRGIAQFFHEQGFERTSIGASMGQVDKRAPWDVSWEESEEDRKQSEQNIDAFLAAVEAKRPSPPGANYSEAIGKIHQSLIAPQRKARVHCGVGRNMLAKTGSGKLYPCHRYAGEEAYEIGTIGGGIDREKLERFYREILQGYDDHCSHCWARNICGGQCPWYLSRANGHVGHPDETSCNTLRRGFERHLWLYSELVQRGQLADHADSKASKESVDD